MGDLARGSSLMTLSMIRLGRNTDQGSGGSAPVNRVESSSFVVVLADRLRTLYVCALVGLILALCPGKGLAQDQPTLSGTWSATSMSEKWSTSEWGDACGPKPTGSGAPGGTVTITQAGGELNISGAGRSFSTTQCWEQMPGLKRTSHSGGQRGWSSTCTSAPGDPRRAIVATRLSATDDTIVFNETGAFEFAIDNTACKASVSRSRSFKLIKRAGEETAPVPSASAPPPPPPEPVKTAEPSKPAGECDPDAAPARFELRPARKLLRPGESFTLTSTVNDNRGCRLSITPELSVAEGPLQKSIKIDRLTIAADKDAPEGRAEVVASLGGKSVTIVIELTPADKYDELLKLRGLNAAGEDDRAAVAEIAAAFGGAPSTAEDTAKKRRVTFLVVVGGVAALLGLVGLALLRRGKRAHERETESVDFVPPSNVALFDAAGQSLACPQCGRVYPVSAGFCETDGSALVGSSAPAPAGLAEPPAAPPAASARRPAKKAPDKICPNCGDRFGADAGFCGKDGTQLVPIN